MVQDALASTSSRDSSLRPNQSSTFTLLALETGSTFIPWLPNAIPLAHGPLLERVWQFSKRAQKAMYGIADQEGWRSFTSDSRCVADTHAEGEISSFS